MDRTHPQHNTVPLVYQVVSGINPVKYARYILPVLPFYCITAAILCSDLLNKLEKFNSKLVPIVGSLFLALLLYQSLKYILYFNRRAGKKDSCRTAFRWIHENIPKGASLTILVAEGTLDMSYDLTGNQKRWISFKEDGRSVIQGSSLEKGVNYLIVSKNAYFAKLFHQYDKSRFQKVHP